MTMDCAVVKSLFSRWAQIMAANREYLIKLDAVAGDGDLGIVMDDGFNAVEKAIQASEETDLGKLIYLAGKTLSKAAPSSMGTLIAMGLLNAAKLLHGKTEVGNEGILDFFSGIADGIMKNGNAKEGEKTYLDAILPAIRAGRESVSKPAPEFAKAMANAAEIGFHDTAAMIARHGRIAYRGENSVGIEDPGAAVAMLMIKGLSEVYSETS